MTDLRLARIQRIRRASLTSLANGTVALSRAVASFFVIPLLIGYLGAERYGLILTVMGIAGWLAVADGGFAISMKNMLLKTYAEGSAASEEASIVSGAFFLSFLLAVSLGCITTILLPLLPWSSILNVTEVSAEILLFLGASVWLVLLAIPFGIGRQIQSARQKEFESSPTALLGVAVGLGLTYLATSRDWGLIVASTAVLLGGTTCAAMNMFWIQYRDRLVSRGSVQKQKLKELVSVGGAFWIVQLGSLLIFQSNIFIANLILGNAAAATFGLHFQLVAYLTAALTLLVGPYWSALSEAWHRRDFDWFRKIVSSLHWLTFAVAGTYSLLLIFFGDNVLQFWAKGAVKWDAALMWLLCANLVVQSVVGVSATALGALGIARETAVVVTLHAVLHVVLTVVLTRLHGLHGLAAGALISNLTTSGWYVVYKLRKLTIAAEK